MHVIKPSSDFEQVSGKIIRDFDVVTIGVYAKLLAFGDSWNLNIKGLSSSLCISVDKTRKAITELEEAGFIVRKPSYENGKLKGWEYFIYGNAVGEEERSKAGLAGGENSQCWSKSDNTENDQDNIYILKRSNILKKDYKENIKKVISSFNSPIVASLWDKLLSYPEWKKKTPHALELRANKLQSISKGKLVVAIASLLQTLDKGWADFYDPYNEYVEKARGELAPAPSPKEESTPWERRGLTREEFIELYPNYRG